MRNACIYISFILGILLIVIPISAREIIAPLSSFSIVSQSSESIDVLFSVPDYDFAIENVNNVNYKKINIDGAGYICDNGAPELPYLSTIIAIPQQGQVSFEVINTQDRFIDQFVPFPAQSRLNSSYSQGFDLNEAIYNSSQIYQNDLICISEPQILRDFRVITIELHPFAWDGATNQLIVKNAVEFRLNFVNEPGINELNETLSISSLWTNIYEASILNFSDYRYAIVANTPPKILIIHGNYSDATFINKINDFAFWKKQKGADVQIVSTATTGIGNTAIKSYIQNQYNNTTTRPDFIILIGDVTGSFPIPTWLESLSGNSGGGDYPYQQLAGNDALGDCFLGRISAENVSELDVILSKTLLYEKNINISTAQWLNRMLLVGDTAPSGQSTVYTCKYIKEIALDFNPDYTFFELYSADPSPGVVNSSLNTGVGIFNYRGIYGMSSWSPSNNLTNGFKLPHAVIITCSTGDFWNGTATSEAFIRLGTTATPKGAVTAIGMSTSETHTMYNNCLSGGIFNGLYTYHMNTMGEALLNGKLYLNEIYGTSHSIQSQYFAHWCNLMGDPTMEVFCTIPHSFALDMPTSVPLGTNYMDVIILNEMNEPVDNACVTISQNGIILTCSYSNSEGLAMLFINEDIATGNLELTVSKHEFKPLQQVIEVNISGSLVTSSSQYDDDNNGNSFGNGDNIPNSGERMEVLFSVKNTTNTIINNVNGYVSSLNPYISVIDSIVTFGNINPGVTAFSTIPALIQILPECPDNAVVRLDLHLMDETNIVYIVPSIIIVTNASLSYMSHQVSDTNNQALDPNETVTLTATVVNNGSIDVTDISGQLFTLNDLVSLVDDNAFFGNIAVNGQATCTANSFQIAGRANILPGMRIPMRIKLSNPAGFLQWIDLTLNVGVVTIISPFGPDDYGYVIYDDGDISYPECPTYQWVGISPAEFGTGTALAISDPDAAGEGDGVGAQSMAWVTLPFEFQFYGITYDQISVCSNGFIVMGFSANAEFRNYRLPGAMGPSPMIAAFWDDLATSPGSGIYTWYDVANHQFIIEWYQMKNGFLSTSNETFQIVLYNQAFYPSSQGDGPIKIQYNTFNNVDSGTSDLNHGNYCTIGIENHNQLIGLEYTYNNTYPTAARPLANGRCFYITNAPVYYALPVLALGLNQVSDTNGNGVLEPGETIQLNVQLTNTGEANAYDTIGTLSTTDPFVMITNADAQYPTINHEGSAYNLSPYTFNISPNCPGNHVVNFTLDVVSGEYTIQLPLSLTVEKPELSLASFYLNDISANNNGIADPNEDFLLVLNLTNLSPSDAVNISGTLSTTQPNVTIGNATQTKPGLQMDQKVQMVFPIHFGALATGTSVPFSLAYVADNATPGTLPLSVICGSGPVNRSGVINGIVTMSNAADPSLVLLTTDNDFYTYPEADGSYAFYFQNGVYTLTAVKQYYYNAGIPSVTITDTDLTHVRPITMAFLANPTGLEIVGNNGETMANLNWVAPQNPVYQVVNYKVYRQFEDGEFAVIAQPTTTTLVDDLVNEPFGTYTYYVSCVYSMGEGAPGESVVIAYPFVANDDPIPGMVNALYTNFPNPFNPKTSLSFSLAKAGQVSLKIYNTKGQLIKTLVDDTKAAGMHRVVWSGDDNAGKSVSSGMYLYKVQAGKFTSTRKMMMLK